MSAAFAGRARFYFVVSERGAVAIRSRWQVRVDPVATAPGTDAPSTMEVRLLELVHRQLPIAWAPTAAVQRILVGRYAPGHWHR